MDQTTTIRPRRRGLRSAEYAQGARSVLCLWRNSALGGAVLVLASCSLFSGLFGGDEKKPEEARGGSPTPPAEGWENAKKEVRGPYAGLGWNRNAETVLRVDGRPNPEDAQHQIDFLCGFYGNVDCTKKEVIAASAP